MNTILKFFFFRLSNNPNDCVEKKTKKTITNNANYNIFIEIGQFVNKRKQGFEFEKWQIEVVGLQNALCEMLTKMNFGDRNHTKKQKTVSDDAKKVA